MIAFRKRSFTDDAWASDFFLLFIDFFEGGVRGEARVVIISNFNRKFLLFQPAIDFSLKGMCFSWTMQTDFE